MTKNPSYIKYVPSVDDISGAMGRFQQWLIMQPDVVHANGISTEISLTQMNLKKTPRGIAKGTTTQNASKKTVTLDNSK